MRQIPGQNKQEKEKGHLRAQVLRDTPKILEWEHLSDFEPRNKSKYN